MNNLKYVCVQPRSKYYTWQIEVMINTMIKNGISGNDIEVILVYNPKDSTSDQDVIEMWHKIICRYNYVRFFQYEDTRTDLSYIPSIYFNGMKHHLKAFPELKNYPLFIFDADTIITKPVNFSSMLKDDAWYLSDTVSYIGYQYIISKGEEVYKMMCETVGIDPLIPKLMNSNSGGAQYITKNTTYDFWDKVEKDSIELYKNFCEMESSHTGSDYPIQKWTAGMWSLLWNAWLFGHETIVDKRLDFCWATDSVEKWDQTSIFHNAGVTCSCNGQFYKANYTINLPYNLNLRLDQEKCGYRYYQEIQETEKITCLI